MWLFKIMLCLNAFKKLNFSSGYFLNLGSYKKIDYHIKTVKRVFIYITEQLDTHF